MGKQYLMGLIIVSSSINADQNHYQELATEYQYLADHLLQAGKTEKARDLYLKAVSFDPLNYSAHEQLGNLFFEQNEIDKAIEHFQTAFSLNKTEFSSHFNLSQSYLKKEAWSDALYHLKQTVALNPNHEKAYFILGTTYQKINQYEDALLAYQKAITLNPTSCQAYLNLGSLYRHLERLEDALEPFKKAVELAPNDQQILLDCANIYNMLNQHKEALDLYEKILEKNPHAFSVLYNFGFTLKKMGKLQQALDIYEKVLEKIPDYAPAHFSRSSIYLARGDLEKGWQEYEWRWKTYDESATKHDFPAWQGQDLRGKILYIFAEQGLGDTLQFIRYIPVLKQQYPGLRIIFETQEPLFTLLKQQSYIDLLISRNQRPAVCDYQIALMTIPFILNTRLNNIPANTPYLQVPQELITYWRDKLSSDKKFKIGICWQGNAGYSILALRRAVASKSIHLKLFAPLFEIPNVSIYSLQRMHGCDQINECSFKDKLICFDDSFDNEHGRFMDTAALMHSLDLVISIDTGTCHLAAAMNIPTWIILPFPSDWRWLLDRSDSPWYPTVTLFRQEKMFDWQPVIMKIAYEIRRILGIENEKSVQPKALHHDKPSDEQLLFFEKLGTFS